MPWGWKIGVANGTRAQHTYLQLSKKHRIGDQPLQQALISGSVLPCPMPYREHIFHALEELGIVHVGGCLRGEGITCELLHVQNFSGDESKQAAVAGFEDRDLPVHRVAGTDRLVEFEETFALRPVPVGLGNYAGHCFRQP